MVNLKLSKVVSFSSESKKFPASNLLLRETPNDSSSMKWLANSNSEDKAFVVIQLQKPSVITAVEIGNEGSAFIEALVSNDRKEFICLIPNSSFMSPMESRINETRNRIRTFTQFDEKSSGKPWNFIKLVCKQPFNKTWPFGIAFFTLRGSPEDSLNEEQGDVIINDPGLSAVHYEVKEPGDTEYDGPSRAKKRVPDVGHELNSHEQGIEEPSEGQHSNSHPKRSSPNQKCSTKLHGQNERKILEGVVMVLSGFQNPLRRQIRDLGLSLGAKYVSDWGPQCTHLISAFSNTPKWSQVAAQGGRIVTKEWLDECQRLKQKLPWKQFKCGKYRDKVQGDLKQQDSDQEGTEEEEDLDDDSEYEPEEDERSLETRSEKVSFSKFQIDELNDFFSGEHFFLDSDIGLDDDRDTLTRYIVGHGGDIVTSSKLAKYVVSWKSEIYTPQWVVECHQSNRLIES